MTAAMPATIATIKETLYSVPEVPVSGFSFALALSLLHVSESGAKVQASLMMLFALTSGGGVAVARPKHPTASAEPINN